MSISINIVKSDSMSPTLVEGDIVAWAPISIEDVEIGDIIVFKSYMEWPEKTIIVHRVTDILKDNEGNPILETKGDNYDWFDQAGPNIAENYIIEEQIMGKIISIGEEPLTIPYVVIISLFVIFISIMIVSLLPLKTSNLYQYNLKSLVPNNKHLRL